VGKKISNFTAKGTHLRKSTSFEPFCVNRIAQTNLQAWAGKKSESLGLLQEYDVSPLTQGFSYCSACDVYSTLHQVPWRLRNIR